MSDISNLRDTIVPKSDQLNAEQLLAGPMTITVTEVRRGMTDEQPIIISYSGDAGRPYKPCKSMRKVLVFAWGEDGRQWVGRSMTLFNNPEVMFGGVKVGGIRISHLTDIERDIALSLTKTRGKKEQFVIQRMATDPKVEKFRARLTEVSKDGVDKLNAAWSKTPASVRNALGESFINSLRELTIAQNLRNDSHESCDVADLNQRIDELQNTNVDSTKNDDHF